VPSRSSRESQVGQAGINASFGSLKRNLGRSASPSSRRASARNTYEDGPTSGPDGLQDGLQELRATIDLGRYPGQGLGDDMGTARVRTISTTSDVSVTSEFERSMAAMRRDDSIMSNSITVHQTCPRCRGKGRIAKDAIGREELVALVPFSDERLKPKRTKQIVTVWIVFTLAAMATLTYFLWPRQVSTAPIDAFVFQQFDGRQCGMKTTQCQLRSCNSSMWPIKPYCNIQNDSTFEPSICQNNSFGCYCGYGKKCSGYDDCRACGDLHEANPCNSQHACQWKDGMCDGLSIGPIWFSFNYTVVVTNNNYFSASLFNGDIILKYTDTNDIGQTLDLPLVHEVLTERSVPARSSMQLTVPLNVTLHVWNQKQKQASAEFLRDLLHDVCDKAAGKCTNSTGGNTPTRDQFFLTFQLGLTASVLGAHTQLNENRLIGLRRTCPQQNSTGPDVRTGEELWVSETIEDVADVIQKSAGVAGVAAGPGEKGPAVAIQ
jgi:hypothetical protein